MTGKRKPLDHSFLKILVSGGDHVQKVSRLDTVSDHGFNHFSVAWFSGRGSSHHKNGMQLRNLCINSARRDTLSNLAWVFQWDIESVKLLIAGPHVFILPMHNFCSTCAEGVHTGTLQVRCQHIIISSISKPDFQAARLSIHFTGIAYTFYAHNICIYIYMLREKANTCINVYVYMYPLTPALPQLWNFMVLADSDAPWTCFYIL